MTDLLLVGATLIDGTGAAPVPDAVIKVEGGRIVAAGAREGSSLPDAKRVVDATGAGDLFAAGFLYGLTSNRETRDCLRLGALAAAEIISHVGARPDVVLKTLAGNEGLL